MHGAFCLPSQHRSRDSARLTQQAPAKQHAETRLTVLCGRFLHALQAVARLLVLCCTMLLLAPAAMARTAISM